MKKIKISKLNSSPDSTAPSGTKNRTARRWKIWLALALACLPGVANTAHAQTETITFSSLTDTTDGGNATLITSSYLGFTWNNVYVMNVSGNLAKDGATGYNNGESTTNVGLSGYGNPASFSDTGLFTFQSGEFAGAWNSGMTVTVQGLLNGKVEDTKSFVVNTSGPVLETFDWTGINAVDISSSGGTQTCGLPSCEGEQVVMDDLVVTDTAIPEPGVCTMAGIGAVVLLFHARRRQVRIQKMA